MKKEIDELNRLLDGLSDWREKVVFAGGTAALIYAATRDFPDVEFDPTITDDFDMLLDRSAHSRKPDSSLAVLLKELGYRPEQSTTFESNSVAPEKWVKPGNQSYLEFITDDHNQRVHEIGGVAATGLSFVRASYESNMPFTIDGKIGRVVSPAAFVFHKGLTFPRRLTDGKRFKDVYYIAYVCDQILGGASSSRVDVAKHAKTVVPNWTGTFVNNMRTILTWNEDILQKVVANDPEGYITIALVKIVAKSLAEIEHDT